jgi:hypothetical protein
VAEATATTEVVESMEDMEAGTEVGTEVVGDMAAAPDMADTDITEDMRRQAEANAPRIFPTGRPNPLKSSTQPEVTITPPYIPTRAA